MRNAQRGRWRGRTLLLLAIALLAALWAHRQPLLDIVRLGFTDEEQSHILLAPLVALWLLWLRRSRCRCIQPAPSLLGPAIAAGAWMLSWWGFEHGVQIAWHGGALLTFLGVLIAFAGWRPLKLLAPVFVAMLFILPVPGTIRHEIAWPLQQHATAITHSTLEVIGVSAVRSGNVLLINGEEVAVGEACNGMRLVFALTLVVYAFAFGSPLRTPARVALILLSPFIALLCNVIRLVPTSLLYGFGDAATAQWFHDVAGWVMLPVALLMLMTVLRGMRWLEFPVVRYRLAAP